MGAQESQLGPTGCELTAEITPTGVVRRSSRNTRCGRSRVANLATRPDDAENEDLREAKRTAVDDGRSRSPVRKLHRAIERLDNLRESRPVSGDGSAHKQSLVTNL